MPVYTQLHEGIPAFPGAEGFGAWASGGRGGTVYYVTNLNDSGPGSLREGIEQEGPRTIVFGISGTIQLKSQLIIRHPNITIAGQTAPGDGICIRDFGLTVDADNVIIRHMRFRLGDVAGAVSDAASGRFNKHIIIDHCSFSWSIDECASFYDNDSSTVQWCLIAESLNDSYHPKGKHGYGAVWGGKSASYHHNLFAHHTSRNPRINGSRYHHEPEKDLSDTRNNVIYNWGNNSAYGGEMGKQNFVANYFKAGPATQSGEVEYRIFNPLKPYGMFYIAKNEVYGYPIVKENNWTYGVQGPADSVKEKIRLEKPLPYAPITETSAFQAFNDVVEDVGATKPKRDPLDQRVINEVITGTASYGATFAGGGKGIIDSQEDVGGWPSLKTYNAPRDTDRDGMPDDWEKAENLDPSDPADRNYRAGGEVYTNLERYINEMASGNP